MPSERPTLLLAVLTAWEHRFKRSHLICDSRRRTTLGCNRARNGHRPNPPENRGPRLLAPAQRLVEWRRLRPQAVRRIRWPSERMTKPPSQRSTCFEQKENRAHCARGRLGSVDGNLRGRRRPSRRRPADHCPGNAHAAREGDRPPRDPGCGRPEVGLSQGPQALNPRSRISLGPDARVTGSGPLLRRRRRIA